MLITPVQASQSCFFLDIMQKLTIEMRVMHYRNQLDDQSNISLDEKCNSYRAVLAECKSIWTFIMRESNQVGLDYRNKESKRYYMSLVQGVSQVTHLFYTSVS